MLRDLPTLAKVASSSFAELDQGPAQVQQVIEFIRPYAPDFTAWITKFAQATAYYDANGHYARVQPIFNAFRFDDTAATAR